MSNQKKSNNYESEILGNGIIAVVKPFFKYIKLSCRGIKKVYLSKLQGNLNKSILTVWLSIEGVCIYNLLFNSNVNTWLISGVTSAVVLPCLNFLQVQKDINNNEWFYELYNKLGFKEDYENNIQYPYFSDIKNAKNGNLVYKFFLNSNKLDTFKKNTDLIEEYLTRLFDKYHNVLKIEKDKNDSRILEITCTTKKLTDFFRWGTNLIPEQNKLLIGQSINGIETIKFDSIPHILVAGETGSGKSVVVKGIIMQLLHQTILGEAITIKIADFKGGIDFAMLEEIIELVEDKTKLIKITNNLIDEMNRRIKLLRSNKCENIGEYNKKYKEKKLTRIILVVDELAQCIGLDGLDNKVDKEEIELRKKIKSNLTTLAQLSRAVWINMILGTQVPSSEILGNQLKNNTVGRLCGRFADESASRIVLSVTDAKYLPDTKGRMLFKRGADIVEVQTPYIDNKFIEYYISQNANKLKLIDLTANEIKEKKEKQQDNKITFEELQRQKLEKNKDKNISNK